MWQISESLKKKKNAVFGVVRYGAGYVFKACKGLYVPYTLFSGDLLGEAAADDGGYGEGIFRHGVFGLKALYDIGQHYVSRLVAA